MLRNGERRSSFPSLPHVVLGALLLASTFSAAFAQQPEIDGLASSLAPKLSQEGSKKVLVMDFPLHKGPVTELGVVLGDELAESLGRQAKRFKVVERSRLHDVLQHEKLDPAEERNQEAARWLADLAGANTVVTGEIQPSQNALVLSVVLWDVGEKRKLGSAKGTLRMTKPFENLLTKKVSSFDSPVVDRTPPTPGPPVYKAGASGVGFPGCDSCPAPSYTPAGRRARYEGVVILGVVITAEGRATGFHIYQGGAVWPHASGNRGRAKVALQTRGRS